MQYMPKREFNRDDYATNKVAGAIGYLLFFVPLVACPGSVYGRFCANQGLLYLVAEIALNLLKYLFRFIPILGAITTIIFGIAQVGLTCLMVWLMIMALNNEVRELPYIGNIQLLR